MKPVVNTYKGECWAPEDATITFIESETELVVGDRVLEGGKYEGRYGISWRGY